MTKTILGIGNPFFDRALHVDTLPPGLVKGDTSITQDRTAINAIWAQSRGNKKISEWTLGGSCTNVIQALARMGNSCTLLGKIGYDRKANVDQLLHNIGVGSLLVEGSLPAGFVNCYITPDGDRTMQAFLGASIELSERHILPGHFKHASHVHIEGYLAHFDQVLERSIELAKANKTTISLCLGSVSTVKDHKKKLLDCAQRVDYLFGNFQEMQALTDSRAIEDIFKKLGPSRATIVVTDGANGCWVRSNGDVTDKFDAAVIDPNTIKDTVGAGDFFAAGFLHGALHGKNLATSVRIANLAASHIIQQQGTDLPNDQWGELNQKIDILTHSDLAVPHSNALNSTCRKYLEFIGLMSQGKIEEARKKAMMLFTLDCKKVLNGEVLTNTTEEFLADLQKVYQETGGWKVTPANILVDPIEDTAILHLTIEMANKEPLTAIALLKFKYGLIAEINEVLASTKSQLGPLSD